MKLYRYKQNTVVNTLLLKVLWKTITYLNQIFQILNLSILINLQGRIIYQKVHAGEITSHKEKQLTTAVDISFFVRLYYDLTILLFCFPVLYTYNKKQ